MFFIANTFFELELEGLTPPSLEGAFKLHPIFKQLQFLPFLFLEPDDTVVTFEPPPEGYLKILKGLGISDLPSSACLKEVPKGSQIGSWGASDLIHKWAKEKGMHYAIPPLSLAAQMNSKLWNFSKTPHLPYAALVSGEKELEAVLEGEFPLWVAKTDQGFSGRGHCIFSHLELPKALHFCSKEWSRGRKVIVEPWVDRVLDFSSQWRLSQGGKLELLGLTKCLNTQSGAYKGTETGPEALLFGHLLPFVHEHVQFCKTYLKDIVEAGYFGFLGVDAMIYQDQGKIALHPALEINARMTMSCALLLFYKRHGGSFPMKFHFQAAPPDAIGLLPNGYKRQLTFII